MGELEQGRGLRNCLQSLPMRRLIDRVGAGTGPRQERMSALLRRLAGGALLKTFQTLPMSFAPSSQAFLRNTRMRPIARCWRRSTSMPAIDTRCPISGRGWRRRSRNFTAVFRQSSLKELLLASRRFTTCLLVGVVGESASPNARSCGPHVTGLDLSLMLPSRPVDPLALL